MTVSLNPCGICNQISKNPLVCKRCLITWKKLFGESEKREVAEAVATKVDSYTARKYSEFPDNPLFKNL